jgi:hypothetical protein
MDMKAMQKAADSIWKAQQAIKAQQAKVEKLKAAQAETERLLLDAMLKAGVEAVSTANTTIAVKRTQFAELFDDRSFFTYVASNDAWDLVRKQANIGACRVRWEDGLTIPGVRPGERVDLSITTRSK